MSNALIAFLFSLGASTWIFSKLHRSTGGNTQSTLIGSFIAGALLFVVALFALNMIPN